MPTLLIVDDQALYRTAIARAAESHGFTIAGKAGDGQQALRLIAELRPDVVSMDLEMPVLDGLGVLRELQAQPRGSFRPKIVVFSAHSAAGATATVQALSLGAADFVLKPGAGEGAAAIAVRLLPRLAALCAGHTVNAPSTVWPARRPAPNRAAIRRLLVIASSTGGPAALEQALRGFPALPVPVLIVQHMPALFTQTLAKHLDSLGDLRVSEAIHGEPLRPGHAYVAPGDWHLEVAGDAQHPLAALHQGERRFHLRPAADITFRSVAERYRGAVVAAVFTGMGCDGADGCKVLHGLGAEIITQRAETCVVYGMPEAVDALGIASTHFAPEDFATVVARYRWAG